MADSLPDVCTVDRSGFVHALVDTGNRSQINDTVITNHLPHLKEDKQDRPPVGAGIEVDSLCAEEFDDMVEDTIFKSKNRLENRLYHYPRNEVRQEHKGLEDLFEHLVGQLIDHDCKCNRQKHSQENKYDVIKQGVSGQRPEFVGYDEELKVVESDPRASVNTIDIVVLFKRKYDTSHGYVGEDDNVGQCRQQHGQQDFAIPSTF